MLNPTTEKFVGLPVTRFAAMDI